MSEFSHLKNKLLAEQVEDQIYHYILDEALEPGAKLPSERELIGRLGFSRATVQRAILDLEQEGLVFRMSRRGTFVADPRLHKSMNRLIGFASEVRAMGGVPGTRLLAFELIEARGTLCEKLGLKEGEGVYYAERLRLKDGVPTVVDGATLAHEISSQLGQPACEALDDLSQPVMITTRDIDREVADISRMIGYAVNMALHPHLSVADIDLYLS